MQHATQDLEQLTREHCALMRDYGRVQLRCTEQMRTQAREIERLQAKVMRLRADAVVRATELAWASEDDDPQALEDSLRAADLVICQTGCLSHGAYWRVQDHCRRTGKACVLVEQAEALRIVRIHGTAAGHRSASIATLRDETS
jgi:sugar phosphate isomerase/epimerase